MGQFTVAHMFQYQFLNKVQKSEYNAAFTVVIYLTHLRMLTNAFLSKGSYIFIEEAPLIILCRKYALCMAYNGKDTKHTIHIDRRVHLVINDEK